MIEVLTADAVPPTSRKGIFRRLLQRPLAVASMGTLALLIVVAICAPLLTPFDPAVGSVDELLQGPSLRHLLGTDSSGRDALSRVIAGAPLSLSTGLFALITALVVGVTMGLLAGYYGGWFDTVSSWVVSIVMALPSIVLLVAARAVFGPSLILLMILLGVFISPVFFRLVYGAVRSVSKELYVDAAKVSGLSDARIIGRHVLSAVRAPIIVQSSLVAGMSVSILAGLEFLGLGNPDTPTWGSLLSAGFQQLYNAPWLMVGPGLALGLTGMAFVLFGNALRDELEGTTSQRPKKARTVPSGTGAGKVLSSRAPAFEDVPNQAPEALPVDTNSTLVHKTATEDVTDPLLRIRDLRIAYDQEDDLSIEVVHGVSLELRRGEIHGLIGESGSGKTQTAWAVLGLLPRGGSIVGGEILLEGSHLETLDDKAYAAIRGGRIGYIPQEPMTNLDPSFTIGSQLMHPLVRRLGLSKNAARETALALLDRVGIPDPARTFKSYPFEISGGMAQRVLIAGAVSMDPEIIIADEPTTALDVTVQAEVLDLLRDLQRERELSMLLVTHNVGVVADLCDRITVMQKGKFVESGPSRTVLRQPQHTYTQNLLGALLQETGPTRAQLIGKE